jgi:signal transduction histidine kinase
LKHAKADIVKLAFRYADCWLEVEVTDNGRGFTTDTVVYGNGISNMRKRAKKVDGEFTITSSLNKGTSILVRVPLS